MFCWSVLLRVLSIVVSTFVVHRLIGSRRNGDLGATAKCHPHLGCKMIRKVTLFQQNHFKRWRELNKAISSPYHHPLCTSTQHLCPDHYVYNVKNLTININCYILLMLFFNWDHSLVLCLDQQAWCLWWRGGAFHLQRSFQESPLFCRSGISCVTIVIHVDWVFHAVWV